MQFLYARLLISLRVQTTDVIPEVFHRAVGEVPGILRVDGGGSTGGGHDELVSGRASVIVFSVMTGAQAEKKKCKQNKQKIRNKTNLL